MADEKHNDGVLMEMECPACGAENTILYKETGEAQRWQCSPCAAQHEMEGSNPLGEGVSVGELEQDGVVQIVDGDQGSGKAEQ